jgi:hypothetical protein
MAIQTLGEAWKLGWRVRARCYWTGPSKSGRRKHPYCDTTVELDMVTLVWTRGENFPINMLAGRLRCPKCQRIDTVRVFFDVPNQPNRSVAAE